MPDENPHLKDWIDRATADGLTGEVTVGGQTKLGTLDNVVTTPVGDQPTQVRLLTAIPRELTPHILTIMAERDRILMDEEAANGPYKSEADLINARNAALLSAIETIRNSLKEPSDGQAS